MVKRLSVADLAYLSQRLARHADAQSAKAGDWTWPYKHPRGTKSVQVTEVRGDILLLSDGSSMHKDHFRRTHEGAIRE